MAGSGHNADVSSGRPVKLKYRLVNLLIDGAVFFFANLSDRQRRILIPFFSFLANLILRRQSRIIEANLRVAFPGMSREECRSLRRRNLRFLIEFGMDFLTALRHPEKILSRIDFPEQIPEGFSDDDPEYILALSHLGNFEALAIMCPRFRKKVAAIAAEFGNQHFNDLLVETRSRYGLRLLPVRGAGIACIRALREHYAVGILMDQNVSPRHGGTFLNFFGLPASVSMLPACLARKMKLPVFFGACIRNEQGRFQFLMRRLPKPVQDYSSDEELTAALTSINEELIRSYPEQYIWLYPRWRYLPDNTPEEFLPRFPWYSRKHHYSCSPELFQEKENHK